MYLYITLGWIIWDKSNAIYEHSGIMPSRIPTTKRSSYVYVMFILLYKCTIYVLRKLRGTRTQSNCCWKMNSAIIFCVFWRQRVYSKTVTLIMTVMRQNFGSKIQKTVAEFICSISHFSECTFVYMYSTNLTMTRFKVILQQFQSGRQTHLSMDDCRTLFLPSGSLRYDTVASKAHIHCNNLKFTLICT